MKVLLAFCAFLPLLAEALVHHYNITHVQLPKDLALMRLQHMARLDPALKPLVQKNAMKRRFGSALAKEGVGEIPFQLGGMITTNITIGTPPQLLTVEVDTLHFDNITVLGSAANVSDLNVNVQKKTFDSSVSTTYVKVKGNYSMFGKKGHWGSDIVNISGVDSRLTVGILDEMGWWYRYYPIDGILGLAPPVPGNTSTLLELLPQLDKPVVSFWNGVFGNNHGYWNGTGQITLGAEDDAHCNSDWVYADRNRRGYSIHLSTAEVELDGEKISVGLNKTILPYTSYRFYVPVKLKDLFVKASAAVYNSSVGEYIVDCNPRLSKNLTFNIGGTGNTTEGTSPLVIQPLDYIRYNYYHKFCFLAVEEYSDTSRYDSIYLTSLFFQNHCQAYNIKKNAVGYATSKTPVKPPQQKEHATACLGSLGNV